MSSEKPKKKWYKRWWFRAPLLLIALLLLGQIILKDFGGKEIFAIDTCDKLSPQIIELSEKDRNPLKPKILKIYEIKARTPRETHELECSGTAKLSSATDQPLIFYLTKPDKDGEAFVGYEFL